MESVAIHRLPLLLAATLLDASVISTKEVPLTASYPKEVFPAEKKDFKTEHRDTVAFLSELFLNINSKNTEGMAESMAL